ncbi:MAG: dephospho-CoA kinase [Clostridia bacterium]|nr:dephospho-CoA kinase [Clostridia bacterium]
MILGITGSSGAGKSTACEILEERYHAKIINADQIARKLSQQGTAYYEKIVQTFGRDILLRNGELDRKKLAEIIYQDGKKRNLLNQCTFQYIKAEIELQIQATKEELIAIDAPLLLEAELERICNYTIAVIANNKEIQLQRMMERDKINKNHAIARLTAQHENEYYIAKCDYCIWNDNDLKDLEEQLKKIMVAIS